MINCYWTSIDLRHAAASALQSLLLMVGPGTVARGGSCNSNSETKTNKKSKRKV